MQPPPPARAERERRIVGSDPSVMDPQLSRRSPSCRLLGSLDRRRAAREGLYGAQAIDPGFGMKNVVAATFDLNRQGYDGPRSAAFHRSLAERLTSRGITSAFVEPVPLSGGRFGTVVSLEGLDRKYLFHMRSFLQITFSSCKSQSFVAMHLINET